MSPDKERLTKMRSNFQSASQEQTPPETERTPTKQPAKQPTKQPTKKQAKQPTQGKGKSKSPSKREKELEEEINKMREAATSPIFLGKILNFVEGVMLKDQRAGLLTAPLRESGRTIMAKIRSEMNE